MSGKQKQLILSFHDLHPGSWDCCKEFIKKCQKLGADKMTLLVIPQYHGEPPFHENSALVKWLQALPVENFDLCLHGYYHRTDKVKGGWIQQLKGKVYTTGEGEFYQLNYDQAMKKLQAGLSLFIPHQLPVYGFTAPAWLASFEAKKAILDSGFLYNTFWDGVELPASNLFIKAPTLVYSSRNLWRRIVSKFWVSLFHFINRNTQILRIAAHPIDFDHPGTEAHIYKVIKTALQTRTPLTYRDLIPLENQRPVSLATS